MIGFICFTAWWPLKGPADIYIEREREREDMDIDIDIGIGIDIDIDIDIDMDIDMATDIGILIRTCQSTELRGL